MKMKRIINKLLALLGYQIIRKNPQMPAPEIVFNNFVNLSKAYEQLLNDFNKEVVISPDDMRIQLITRLLGTPPPEAYYLIQGLIKTRAINGDVCEFGVAHGGTSALIAHEISKTQRKLHLFDSFKGLPKPTEKDKLKDDIFSLGASKRIQGGWPVQKIWLELA